MSNLYDHPAYEEGCQAARYVIAANSDAHQINNPHPDNTEAWRAWNLGWNTTLRTEQP